MKITIIIGSHRVQSQSEKVANYISGYISQQFPEDQLYTFSFKK